MKRQPFDPDSIEQFETRLKQLQPQPCRMSATELLRTAEKQASPEPVSVDRLSKLHWAYLAATGCGGIVVGALVASICFLIAADEPSASNIAAETPRPMVNQQAANPNREVEKSSNEQPPANEPVQKWSRNDLAIARQLAALGESTNAMSPLSASFLVWQRSSFVEAGPEFHISESTSLSMNDESAPPTRTIGASDSAILLNDIFGL